jgi:hypothetical protein
MVFFIACDFHTLDFYLVRALNVCEVHTIWAGFTAKMTPMQSAPDEIHFNCPKCKRPMAGVKALLGELITALGG